MSLHKLVTDMWTQPVSLHKLVIDLWKQPVSLHKVVTDLWTQPVSLHKLVTAVWTQPVSLQLMNIFKSIVLCFYQCSNKDFEVNMVQEFPVTVNM